MADCPACGGGVDATVKRYHDVDGYSDLGAFGTVLSTCHECGVLPGVSSCRSDRAHGG